MESMLYSLPILAILAGAWIADAVAVRRASAMLAHNRALRIDARYRRMMRVRVARQGR